MPCPNNYGSHVSLGVAHLSQRSVDLLNGRCVPRGLRLLRRCKSADAPYLASDLLLLLVDLRIDLPECFCRLAWLVDGLGWLPTEFKLVCIVASV